MLPRTHSLEWLSACVFLLMSLTLQLGCGNSVRELSSPSPSVAPSGAAGTAPTNSGPAQPNVPGADNAAAQPGLQLSIIPSTISFNSVNIGSTAQVQATLSAIGGDVTISGDTIRGNGFGLSGLTFPLTLAPGQTSSFAITFSPGSLGAVNGALSFTSNASNTPAIALSGSGSGLGVTPGAVPSFGTIPDGTSSAPQAGTLIAVGSAVTIMSVSLVQEGSGGSAFSISGLPPLPFTLAAGSTQNYAVIFSPALDHPGLSSATLSFTSSVNSVSQALSGTGSAIVQLSWIASATAGVTYNVYRCSGSSLPCQSGLPSFVQVQTANANTTYNDTGVLSGQTYYYFVAAVDARGIEGAPSVISGPAIIP